MNDSFLPLLTCILCNFVYIFFIAFCMHVHIHTFLNTDTLMELHLNHGTWSYPCSSLHSVETISIKHVAGCPGFFLSASALLSSSEVFSPCALYFPGWFLSSSTLSFSISFIYLPLVLIKPKPVTFGTFLSILGLYTLFPATC